MVYQQASQRVAPFAVACLISYLLYPLVELNSRCLHLKSHVAASLITIFEVTCMLGMLGYFVVPSVIDEIHQLQDIIKRGSDSTSTVPFIPEEIAGPVKEWARTFDLEEFVESSKFESLLHSGTSFLSWTVGALFHTLEWLMTFVYIIFILIDYKSIMADSACWCLRNIVSRRG